tara:strand:+ start:1264 stop:2748 length:1485 start_codon:yes stop_codon:yes gene_type:complete
MVGKKELKNKWFIAIKENKGDIFDTKNLFELSSPKGVYYADPFLFKKDNINYLFFEDTDYNKGMISYCTINKKLEISKPKVILERPYHLSFPCIFQDGEDIYMIPETGTQETLELYKAVEFPNKWEPHRIIYKGAQTSDPIIYKHNGVWFLICTIKAGRHPEKQGVDLEICSLDDGIVILYADNINDTWNIHPKCKDFPLTIPNSRLAGNLFEYEGKLIKPVQKREPLTCRYGYGIGFKEIELSKTEYNEKIIDKEILPYWGNNLIGTHTFNFTDDFIVLDGKIKVTKDTEEIIKHNESTKMFPAEDKQHVDYWFPRNPNYKTKASVEKREENLKILTSTLKKFNIDSCLIFGTLLGAVRGKSLIPHDHDDDVFVYENDRDLFTRELIIALEKKDLRIMRVADNNQTLSFYRDGYYIDVYFVQLNDKNKWQWREVEMSKHYFDKLDTITLHNGDTFNTPYNAEDFLQNTYGKDWRTPKEPAEAGWVNGKYAPIN